ncbi:MAG: hypothetical protein HQM11_20620 [SAR324 cluster bacterium]|nr:hypothetical protein [SAR324 cluster bacterium]
MKKLKWLTLVLVVLFATACADTGDSESSDSDSSEDSELSLSDNDSESSDDSGESKVSTNGLKKSHNTGQNCLGCHVSGGKGEGIFTVAGSVYNLGGTQSNPNGKVTLYDQSNGQGSVIKVIEIDGNGNFYTTENIDFGSGLYAIVQSSSGNTTTMASAITSGACSSCHGNTVGTIKVE